MDCFIARVEVGGFKPWCNSCPFILKAGLKVLLSNTLETRRALEDDCNMMVEMLDRLLSILEDLNELCLFKPSDSKNIIGDLVSRHICVQKSECKSILYVT